MKDANSEQPNAALPAPVTLRAQMNLKRAFLTGFAALLPTALTIMVFVWVFRFIMGYVAGPINTFIIWIIDIFAEGDRQEAANIFYADEGRGLINFSFVGFVVALGVVFLVGFMLLTFFGRRIYGKVDSVLSRVPMVKMIYPHLKQLTEFILSEEKVSFRRVVMIPYPRHGLYSLGFLTGLSFQVLREKTGEDLVSVFIPSSPTPFTGYVVAVRREEVLEIDITVDEALRFSVSGGVLVPPAEMSPEAQGSHSLLPEFDSGPTED